jgi:hypothetical protein
VADLDRLEGGTLVATLDVTDLVVGEHEVPVTADLPAGVTLVTATPPAVTVTITAPSAAATTAPGPSPGPGASSSPSPGG